MPARPVFAAWPSVNPARRTARRRHTVQLQPSSQLTVTRLVRVPPFPGPTQPNPPLPGCSRLAVGPPLPRPAVTRLPGSQDPALVPPPRCSKHKNRPPAALYAEKRVTGARNGDTRHRPSTVSTQHRGDRFVAYRPCRVRNRPCHPSSLEISSAQNKNLGTILALSVAIVARPRRIAPAETYLITRRCYQRTFRLRPCAQTNRIFMYCLALALQKTNVVLHAVCVMSDHHHLVVTDTSGRLPDFLRELHRLTAKAMNALQGQWENLWSAESCNAVRLATDDDIIDKIAYVVANPVAAGLVARPGEWPGFVAWGTRRMVAQRPTVYFRENGLCAREHSLDVRPPLSRDRFVGLPGEWAARVTRAIADKVNQAHARMRNERRAFVGRTAVLAAKFEHRAQSYEAKRGRIPSFAAVASIVRDRLKETERKFRALYRTALERWRQGDRAVVFPFGTWAMRVLHSVAVGPPFET